MTPRPYVYDLSWVKLPTLVPSDRIEEDGVFELAENWDCVFTLDRKQYAVRVPVGFITDGPSIPLGFRYLVPMTNRTWPAALAHDVFYCFQGWGKMSRKAADRLFGLGLSKQGVEAWRLACMYEAVHLFGGRAWRDESASDKINRQVSVACVELPHASG